MKKNDNSFNGKVIAALDKLGLTAGELAIVQDYLDSDPRDESILDAITPRDLSTVPYPQTKPIRELSGIARSKKDKAHEDLKTIDNIIFAIGHSTSGRVTNLHYSMARPEEQSVFVTNIDDCKRIAIEAGFETADFYNRSMKMHTSEIWQLAADNDPVLDKAAQYCDVGGKWPLMYIRSMQYYHRFAHGSDDSAMRAEFEKGFVPFIIEEFCQAVSGLTVSETKTLDEYIMSNTAYGAPLDDSVRAVCRKASLDQAATELISLLKTAVLLWQRSDILARIIRLITEINIDAVVSILCGGYRSSFACERLSEIEQAMPIDTEKYIRACAGHNAGLEAEVKRLYDEKHDVFIRALENSTGSEARDILAAISRIDSGERSRLTAPGSDFITKFRDRTARLIADEMPAGRDELYHFFTGKAGADAILPFIDAYKDAFNRGSNVFPKISAFLDIAPDDLMSGRLKIYLLCVGYAYSVVDSCREKVKFSRVFRKGALGELFSALDNCGWPRKEQYRLVSVMYNDCNLDETKASFIEQFSEVISSRLNEDNAEAEDILSAPIPAKLAACYLFDYDPERYKDYLLALSADGSKQVRDKALEILRGQPTWTEDIFALLSSKKSFAREAALDALVGRDLSKYNDRLQVALSAEKSQKLRERLEGMLGAPSAENKTAEKSEDAQPTVDGIIARYIKSGKKRSLDWIFEEPMPEVRRSSGDGTDTDALQAVMLAYSSMPRPGVSEDAKIIAAELNAADLEAVARETLARWLDSGADAKKKWVLYFASIHGGDTAAQTIITNINQWPLQSRGAIAAEAVNALALSPAPSALMTVDSLSRKCKFKQVKAAAQKALDFAAQQLGITSEQLADRIVPDLGFDTSMTRVFDYGPRSFTVRLTPALDLIITDQTGKRIKNLPAVVQKDDIQLAAPSCEQFKLLKKQLKAVTATQKLRLELALSSGRQWTAEAWRQLFVNIE